MNTNYRKRLDRLARRMEEGGNVPGVWHGGTVYQLTEVPDLPTAVEHALAEGAGVVVFVPASGSCQRHECAIPAYPSVTLLAFEGGPVVTEEQVGKVHALGAPFDRLDDFANGRMTIFGFNGFSVSLPGKETIESIGVRPQDLPG